MHNHINVAVPEEYELPGLPTSQINIDYLDMTDINNILFFIDSIRSLPDNQLIVCDTETYDYTPSFEHPLFYKVDSKGKSKPIRLLRLASLYIPTYNLNQVYVLDFGTLLKDDDIICTELVKTEVLDVYQELVDELYRHTVIMHNHAFDVAMLKPNYLPYMLEDTLYLARQAFPYAESKGLEALVEGMGLQKYYTTDMYTINNEPVDTEEIDKSSLQKSNFSIEHLDVTQIVYSAADVVATWGVFINPTIQRARKKLSYKLDMQNARQAAVYQQNKLYTDVELIKEEMKKDEQKISEYKQTLVDLGFSGLNPNSSKQCTAAMQRFDSSITSSDKQSLITAITSSNTQLSKLAETIYNYRRAKKSDGMLESYSHGWVQSRYNVGGANTGRFTSSGDKVYRGVNTQQIPRARRNVFIPRDGNVIVGADYPTIELRVIASLYPNMLNALGRYNTQLLTDKRLLKYWYDVPDVMYQYLKDGVDLHYATASSLTGLSIEKIDSETRFKAKAVNFGLAFGMGAPAFQDYAFVSYGITYSIDECRNIHKVYRETYPEVDRALEFFIKALSRYKSTFLANTVGGRIAKPRRVTDGINLMVQGSAADVYKLSKVHMLKETDGESLKYDIFPLHDAAYYDVPKHLSEEFSIALKYSMEKAWRQLLQIDYFKYNDVPLDVEVKVADRLMS